MTRRLEGLIQEGLDQRIFSGVQCLIGRSDEVILECVCGTTSWSEGAGPVDAETVFDVASLTKPIVTTTALLLLIGEGKVNLETPVVQGFPEFVKKGGDGVLQRGVTLRHLLAHTSGLPAWRPYFREFQNSREGDARSGALGRGSPAERGGGGPPLPRLRHAKRHPPEGSFEVDHQSRKSVCDRYLQRIFSEKLESEPGTSRLYSDLGFIILGEWVERLGGLRLDRYFEEKIAAPLGLRSSFFCPLGEGSPRRSAGPLKKFAATSFCPWRGRQLIGEVDDENAAALGGVAGHAGLFQTARDGHRFVVALKKGISGTHPLFSKEGLADFLTHRFKAGWDTPTPGASQAGRFFSANTIGHLGFTGCSVWIDLDRDWHMVLYTNRVHPSREGEAIKAWRPKMHDAAYEEVIATGDFGRSAR